MHKVGQEEREFQIGQLDGREDERESSEGK